MAFVAALSAASTAATPVELTHLSESEHDALAEFVVWRAVESVRAASVGASLDDVLQRVVPSVAMATTQLAGLHSVRVAGLRRQLRQAVLACVASGLAAQHSSLGAELKAFFHARFVAFDRHASGYVDDGDVENATAVDDDVPFDVDQYRLVCVQLHSVGLISACEDLITHVLFAEISARVDGLADSSYERPILEPLRAWLQSSVKSWLELTLHPDVAHDAGVAARHWLARLDGHAVRSVAAVRCAALMNIVREYPDSIGALDDLRACLQVTGEFERVVRALNEQYDMRLLHLGANTSDIITQFVSTIAALRYVEPAGVMLEHVLDPIRAYLRGRDDTIRCMLHAFTDESSELYDEFMHGDASAAAVALCDDDIFSGEVNDERRAAYRAWQPDPIHAHTSSSRAARQTDTISMLVSIYGSSARFVKEYRNILGERLLMLASFAVDSELTQAEMFKVRFGELSMAECGIMLKDVGDAKRVNAHVASETNVAPLAVMICSYLSWPTLKQATLKLPDWLTARLDAFAAKYRVHKAQRDLQLAPHHGAVELDVQPDGADAPISVTCSPLQATVVLCFATTVSVAATSEFIGAVDDSTGAAPSIPVSDEDAEAARHGRSVDAIAAQVGATADDVRAALAFWAAKRVLKFNGASGLWQIAATTATGSQQQQQQQQQQTSDGNVDVDVDDVDNDDDDDDDDSDDEDDDDLDGADERAGGGGGAGDGNESEFDEARMFIVAMLTNLGALPAARINMMLSNFVSGYSAPTEALTRYLSQMVKDGVLECNSGSYSLKKS
jgi:anaphase-promoting complex subunit 2